MTSLYSRDGLNFITLHGTEPEQYIVDYQRPVSNSKALHKNRTVLKRCLPAFRSLSLKSAEYRWIQNNERQILIKRFLSTLKV